MARKRKILLAVGFILGALLILLVALPLWFPWILQPVLKKYQVHYSRYERESYNLFILHDVKFTNATAKLQAKEVEVLLPAPWLWRHLSGDSRKNFLRVTDWDVAISGSNKSKERTSVFKVAKTIDPPLAQLNHWLPRVALINGRIHPALPGKGWAISIPSAEWKQGSLIAEISAAKILPQTFFNARLAHKSSKQIAFKIAEWNLDGTVETRVEKATVDVKGEMFWLSNRVDVSAEFGRDGSLPDTASIQSKSFQIPAKFLRLEGYHELVGALDLRWETNRFAVDLTAQAQPIESGEIFLSPIEAVIHASGDTNSVRIENANISLPWLHVKLSTNAEFSFRGEMLSQAATLNIDADLSRQKWIAAGGQLKGEAILRRGTNRFPDTTFNLAGTNVAVREIHTKQFDARGKFYWPSLRIESAKVQFDDGAIAEANLLFNAVTRTISEGKLKLNGQIGYAFLPPDVSYENISLAAEFSGPLKNLSHSAHLKLQGVELPRLVPLEISADWRGSQLSLENFQAQFVSKNSTLVLAGSSLAQTNHFSAQVQKLLFTTNEQPVLSLEKPFSISAVKTGDAKSAWAIGVEPFRWLGEKSIISLAGKIRWPNEGQISATAKQIDFLAWQDFSSQQLPEARLEQIKFSAAWTNGPVNFAFTGLAHFFSEDETPFTAELDTSGDKTGMTIKRAEVGTSAQAVISGKGFLPITFNPASKSNLVQEVPNQRIDFHATTTTNAQFWERMSEWTRLNFQEPSAQIAVAGTIAAPQGKILLSAKEVLLKSKKGSATLPSSSVQNTNLAGEKSELDRSLALPGQTLPRFQNVSADFDLVSDHIALHRFEFFVEGQPVTATGELPLPKSFKGGWTNIFDWRKANVHLKIVDAQIAPFQRLFPNVLSPFGTVNLDATTKAGRLNGDLRVAGAALRPIPSLGPVHDIQARLKLDGDQVKLETFKGSIGGQPVDLFGEINLAKKDKTSGLPLFHFKLHGTNVPLARQPEFILRSDIDLNVSNEKAEGALISGALNLRDSFYLSDLKMLVPGKVSRPKQRPPYFSVEAERFANWRLNVTLQGNNFLKVRSPLFRGDFSANLRLTGTLREPAALGDLKINSGVVLLPFANLRVNQGYVSLTSENPYRPQLAINASGRTFGYDVKMDMTGPADKPSIVFTSNPGLTSEQILLMVTAGELPRDEINFSTQQKAGSLAFFLGKNLFSKFGSGGAGEEKLEIHSGEDVSTQGKQTYYLEYKLTQDWSLIGEYDRFGAVNAGFKWKFFSK